MTGKIYTFLRFAFLMTFGANASTLSVDENAQTVVVTTESYQLTVRKEGFRYSFEHPDGRSLLKAHADAGLRFLNADVTQTSLIEKRKDAVIFSAVNEVGVKARVEFRFFTHYAKLSVYLDNPDIYGSIEARTQGLKPAFGLADHAVRRAANSTEVSGFHSRVFGALSDGHPSRLTSNFVVFPQQGAAIVNIEPNKKIVSVSAKTLSQGVTYGNAMPALYYLFGPPKTLYASYLTIRNHEGYKVYKPKYDWFGVGWEAWGALAWNTNAQTIKENVNQYLDLGFPLDWLVIGSGFWPDNVPSLQSTTSFGQWSETRYPDPYALVEEFHNKGMKVILGLRIAFLPGGPYTQEGINNRYFIEKADRPRLFKVSFPKPDAYFLDASKPEAVRWYISLCEKWLDAGIDGFKEDLFGYETDDLPDDKLDAVNAALMQRGVFVMGRNGYLGSPMDLHRYEDFNYNQDQDRGPLNGLAFAYSGFPYVYPDIVAGKGLHNWEFGEVDDDVLKRYFIRNARYASVNPSMSVGYGVWNLNDKYTTEQVKDAVLDHARLKPYFYHAALQTFYTGFPYSLTPLPLAYPHDEAVYGRENNSSRGYQWLIGDALMAAPLYGNDFAQATTRNIYLPKGTWIDYDTGERFVGPRLLRDFPIPLDKTPLFVGNNGFIVEQRSPANQDSSLVGRLYPTGYKGDIVFYYPDGEQNSRIRVESPLTETPVVVNEATKQEIPVKLVRHAYQFTIEAGQNYVVR